MKKIPLIIIALILTLTFSSCDLENLNKNTEPELSIESMENINCTSAVINYKIEDSDIIIDQCGICYSTTDNPSMPVADHSIDGAETGSFYSEIRDLEPNTTYYIKAYAIVNNFVYYSQQTSFTTLDIPIPPCNISDNTLKYSVYTTSLHYKDIDPDYMDKYKISGSGGDAACYYYFAEEPPTGIYKTTTKWDYIGQNEVYLKCLVGSPFAWNFYTTEGFDVYVLNANDKISITYCDVSFSETQSGSNMYFEADVNLIVEK